MPIDISPSTPTNQGDRVAGLVSSQTTSGRNPSDFFGNILGRQISSRRAEISSRSTDTARQGADLSTRTELLPARRAAVSTTRSADVRRTADARNTGASSKTERGATQDLTSPVRREEATSSPRRASSRDKSINGDRDQQATSEESVVETNETPSTKLKGSQKVGQDETTFDPTLTEEVVAENDQPVTDDVVLTDPIASLTHAALLTQPNDVASVESGSDTSGDDQALEADAVTLLAGSSQNQSQIQAKLPKTSDSADVIIATDKTARQQTIQSTNQAMGSEEDTSSNDQANREGTNRQPNLAGGKGSASNESGSTSTTATTPTTGAANATGPTIAPSAETGSGRLFEATLGSTQAGGSISTSATTVQATSVTPEQQFAQDNVEEIVKNVKTTLLPGGGQMKIRLDPPQMGALQITVKMIGGKMSAQFDTDNDQATQLLSHSINHLKSSLEASGVVVEKMQVRQINDSSSTSNLNQKSEGDSSRGFDQNYQHGGEQQRREMVKRMWQRLALGADNVDLVA